MISTSPAHQIIKLVWSECSQRSWLRFNQSMSTALMLAVTAKFQFDVDDFSTFNNDFRGGYWLGDHERYFSEAVEHNNVSACRAYEKWVGRKPFIFGGKRLCVGADIDYQGPVAVTSFNSEKDLLVACGYEGAQKYPRKPTRRVSITRTTIRAMEKERKSAR